MVTVKHYLDILPFCKKIAIFAKKEKKLSPATKKS